RVQDALTAAGSAATVRELPDSAHTAAEAAASLGVDPGQIAKTLVFMVDGAPVLIVLSGPDRLDPARLREHCGAGEGAAVQRAIAVQRATADQVREATGFPIGGVSPVGYDPAAGPRIV